MGEPDSRCAAKRSGSTLPKGGGLVRLSQIGLARGPLSRAVGPSPSQLLSEVAFLLMSWLLRRRHWRLRHPGRARALLVPPGSGCRLHDPGRVPASEVVQFDSLSLGCFGYPRECARRSISIRSLGLPPQAAERRRCSPPERDGQDLGAPDRPAHKRFMASRKSCVGSGSVSARAAERQQPVEGFAASGGRCRGGLTAGPAYLGGRLEADSIEKSGDEIRVFARRRRIPPTGI